MSPQNELVAVDTATFIAKFRDQDVIYQQVDSNNFFDSAKKCHYIIGLSEMSFAEIQNKYPYLKSNFQELVLELKNLDKLIKIDDDSITEKEALERKKDAKGKGYTISKADAYLAILANKKDIHLVSFDQDLIDYCSEIGWKAEYPGNLVKLE